MEHADEMVQALGVDGRQTGGFGKLLQRRQPAGHGVVRHGRIPQGVQQRFRMQEPGMALPQARQIGAPVSAQLHNRAQAGETIGEPVGQGSFFSSAARL